MNQEAVCELAREFTEAWNRGDLPAACQIYAEDATLVTEGGIITGREKLLEGYLAKYSDPDKRGVLALDLLEFRGNDDATMVSAIYRWSLVMPDKTEFLGYSLVTYECRDGRPHIVQDCSI